MSSDLMRLSSNDTERVVKTVRKTENRFAGYNEVDEANNKRDRAMEEIFLRENRVELDALPLEKINQVWLKSHLPCLKKHGKPDVSISNFLKNDSSKCQFFTE